MKSHLQKIIENCRTTWIEMYSQTAERAINWWKNRRAEGTPTLEELSFDLLYSIASIIRFSGDASKVSIVAELPDKELDTILVAGMNYILNSGLKGDVACSLDNRDEIEDDEVEIFEEFLYTRDDYQVTFDLIEDIINDMLRTSKQLIGKLTVTREYLEEVDILLKSNMETVAVSSRSMELVKDMIKTVPDEDSYWWIFEARELDKKIENIIADEQLLFKYLFSK